MTVNDSETFFLPKNIRLALGINLGDTVSVATDGNKLFVRRETTPEDKQKRMSGQYPKGARVTLQRLYAIQGKSAPAGLQGTVQGVDSAGRIHVAWDNGAKYLLVPEFDIFKVEKTIKNKEEII